MNNQFHKQAMRLMPELSTRKAVMKTSKRYSYGLSVYTDKSCYHVRLTVPKCQQLNVVNHLPRSLVAISTGTLYSELVSVDTMQFCFPISVLSPLTPYGIRPDIWLYQVFVDSMFSGMMDTVCPSSY